jgi:hypothetical protein
MIGVCRCKPGTFDRTEVAYRNDGQIGIPRGGNLDCAMVSTTPDASCGIRC